MYPWFELLFETLQKRIASEQLHHGLLIQADKGIGNQTFVNSIAQALVCENKSACGNCKSCKLFLANSHPDIKRVISDKPSIGVDLIREVSEFAISTSQLMGNKVVIIEDIDRMTESASNSLLKTLEEPNNNTFLLLSTSSANAILPTIKSRCEKVTVPAPHIFVAMQWLQTQTTKTVSEQGLLAFSGKPLEYLASLEDTKLNFDLFNEEFEKLRKHTISAYTLAEKNKEYAITVLAWTYQLLIKQYQTVLNEKNQAPVTNQLVDGNQYLISLSNAIDECQQANIKIGQAGINKSLLLQKVFNKIQALP